MTRVLLLHICAIFSVASGQFCFTATRPTANDDNLLIFRCDDANGPVTDPMFFRNTQQIMTLEPTINDGFLYNINRMLEGDFACGMEDGTGMRISLSTTLVGECLIQNR